MMRVFLVACLLLTFFNDGSGQVSFKNNTSKIVSVAILKFQSGDWRVKGWMNLAPGETDILTSTPKNRYVYYFAISEEKTWSGKDATGWISKAARFITDTKTNYEAKPGYKKVGFKLVDAGTKGVQTVTLDLRSDFIINLEAYMKNTKLDPVEGLYTISDEVTYHNEKRILDHWAKVAIIKDTVNLTRNYIQLALEGNGLIEGELIAEYLQTKQSPTLLISQQLAERGETVNNVMAEFVPDEDKVTTSFTIEKKDGAVNFKRTYLRYFPKN